MSDHVIKKEEHFWINCKNSNINDEIVFVHENETIKAIVSDITIKNTDMFRLNIIESTLTEAALRQWKRSGQKLVKKYRCLAGPKKGKLVSDPSACAMRKEPKKVRSGRKVMRSKKGTIQRKSQIAKRRTISKLVRKMNKRLSGNA